ncbi:MAG: hypothetical protein UY06_C0038G0006 [Candidatus Amesbacteria bacterium GW2011_GWA2_47_70]|nr:MAG: hypothetical protein UY06_C0038G0006 [Candidatus Amesbacteria bacterium GW2011_GWA2_47_70]
MSETTTSEVMVPKQAAELGLELVYTDESSHPPFNVLPKASIGIQKNGEKAELIKVSPEHGRATADARLLSTVVWRDDFGIPFGSVDYKGNVVDDVVIDTDQTDKLRVCGIKTGKVTRRIIAASRALRGMGLPTEAIYRMYKITWFPENGRRISPEEWRKQLLTELESDIEFAREQLRNPSTYGQKKDELEELLAKAEEEVKFVKGYLKQNDNFYVFERHLQTPIRLRDIPHAKTKNDFENLAKQSMEWLDKILTRRQRAKTPVWNKLLRKSKDLCFALWPFSGDEKFDFNNSDHLSRVFVEWLPAQMGQYLARLHKNGLIHGFPHSQNWSLGSLYDLDSVYGPALGDNPRTEDNFVKDVEIAARAVMDIFAVRAPGFDCVGLTASHYLAQTILGQNKDELPLVKAVANFEYGYLEARFRKKLTPANVDGYVRRYMPQVKVGGDVVRSWAAVNERIINLIKSKLLVLRETG